MNKILVSTLISKANCQIRAMSVYMIRAQSNFLTEKSIDSAMRELKEIQETLELAKKAYSSPESPPSSYAPVK
jgi:hypothetical protein